MREAWGPFRLRPVTSQPPDTLLLGSVLWLSRLETLLDMPSGYLPPYTFAHTVPSTWDALPSHICLFKYIILPFSPRSNTPS